MLVQIVAPIVALAKKKQFYLAQNYVNAMENVTEKKKIISTKIGQLINLVTTIINRNSYHYFAL